MYCLYRELKQFLLTPNLQVLRTNVGLRNIYVMTRNKTANVARFIRELYARLFNIRLPSANIIVVAPDELKFTHIRKILDSTRAKQKTGTA